MDFINELRASYTTTVNATNANTDAAIARIHATCEEVVRNAARRGMRSAVISENVDVLFSAYLSEDEAREAVLSWAASKGLSSNLTVTADRGPTDPDAFYKAAISRWTANPVTTQWHVEISGWV
jgi:hypothetical protein